MKGLKDELTVDLGDGPPLAIASFNDHEAFFGDAFAIRTPSGAAASGCVAFGLERWLLAVLATHGPDARNWPPARGNEPMSIGSPSTDRHREV